MRSILLFLVVLCALPARAQFDAPAVPETVVAWTARVAPPTTAAAFTDTFAPGEAFFVTLTADVAPGWRLYAHRTPGGFPLQVRFDALPAGLATDGSIGEDAANEGYDEALGEGYRYHEGRARVWQKMRLTRSARSGPAVVRGTVRFAACNDQICLPPRDVPFRARLVVATGGAN